MTAVKLQAVCNLKNNFLLIYANTTISQISTSLLLVVCRISRHFIATSFCHFARSIYLSHIISLSWSSIICSFSHVYFANHFSYFMVLFIAVGFFECRNLNSVPQRCVLWGRWIVNRLILPFPQSRFQFSAATWTGGSVLFEILASLSILPASARAADRKTLKEGMKLQFPTGSSMFSSSSRPSPSIARGGGGILRSSNPSAIGSPAIRVPPIWKTRKRIRIAQAGSDDPTKAIPLLLQWQRNNNLTGFRKTPVHQKQEIATDGKLKSTKFVFFFV